MSDILQELDAILQQRKEADAAESYVASLHQKGLNKILEKLGEESIEVILAAKDAQNSGDVAELVSESADLWFHHLVALSHLGVDSRAVLAELEKRFGLSGLEEKAARNK